MVPARSGTSWSAGRDFGKFYRDRRLGRGGIRVVRTNPGDAVPGTVEIGRAMLTYHDLSLAAFEAGRYAMVHGTGSAIPPPRPNSRLSPQQG